MKKVLLDPRLDGIGCWFIGLVKFIIAGAITFIFRLVTPLVGLHNVSPLMATELVGAKAYGPWVAGAYGFIAMIALDYFVGMVGTWTFTTALCYAFVAITGGYYMKDRAASRKDFVLVSAAGTIFFDIVTGILLSPLPIMVAAGGQFIFTLYHLGGNMFFACFAPWLFWNVIGNPTPELAFISRRMPKMRLAFLQLGLMYGRVQPH